MWKLPDSLARRFPLVARPRPTCLPLPQRIHRLAELAHAAAKTGDPSLASTVCNQAALIASDVGAADIAREMCLEHATAYLHATPLTAKAAIHALEPVVNLARLQLRTGQNAKGRRHLLALFDAVTAGSPVHVEGITVPADLVANTEDRQEVRTWLWSIILADGTRTLTTAGRWTEALAHVETHRGIGLRMLDGRQVAVLAALTNGNGPAARDLLARTEPQEAWENAVTDCLTILCHRVSGRPWRRSLHDLAAAYLKHPHEDDLAVFDTRLGLTVLDIIDSAEDPVARQIVAELHRRTMKTSDGYTARETLTHPRFTALATQREAQESRALIQACALQAGTLPEELRSRLSAALHTSNHIIRQRGSVR